MAKIVTLGEIMLRLSPQGNDRFIQSESFRIIPGGGEANVAISVANYGHEAYFVSKLPKHEIGQIAVNALRRYGVNTEFIARGGDRVGLYYAETGASMRPSKVIYDRAHSAIAEAVPADFDFDKIMEGAAWFHWSGITPAISDKAAELTKLACEAAKRHGVTVSVDLNFRKKLWTSEKAISIMRPLMKYVDVCNEQINTVPGDLILYQGSNLCIYYDTNSWNFTRIGKLDNMTQADIKTWVNAGGDNISVTLSISQPTGISQVKSDEINSKAYTLQGTLAQAGQKGIVIQDGKKIVR